MAEARFLYVHRDDMREWQLATLTIQQDIQSLFEEYDLPGWCGGGTLIGAVRDKGFLYWDNDLDMFFCHEDYKRIFSIFWESGFLKKYDLYHNVNGFWTRHDALMSILNAEELDETGLDFELIYQSKIMFKIFGREGVPVCYFESDNGEPEEYIRIKHFVNTHVTRYRLAHRDDSVDFQKTYSALPDVCMLPMLKIRYRQYLLSNILFLFYRIAMLLSIRFEGIFDRIVRSECYHYQINKDKKIGFSKKFDPSPFDPMSTKIKTAGKNLLKFLVYPLSRKKKGFKKSSGDYIAYRQAFFRFLVLPYIYEDIFPLKKIPFEGNKIFVPANCSEVLTTQFGDFSSVPPVESRLAYPFFLEGRMDTWVESEVVDRD